MAMWQPRQVEAPTPLPRRERRALHVVGAIAALLLVTGLVVRGSIGLTRPPGERIVTVDATTGEVTSGGVELIPATVGAMFPDVQLTPDVPRSACIEIANEGEIDLDAVVLRIDAAEGSALLLDALHLRIERGEPGAGSACEGFEPVTTIAEGRILDLVQAATERGWASWQPARSDAASYRFTVVLPEEDVTDALQGETARVDFLWAATAQPQGEPVLPRVIMLAAAVARDAALPLLLLAVVAVLFLGIQDRIDRRDPKLAMAAVHEEPRAFRASGADQVTTTRRRVGARSRS